jgi:hypothetical protein
MPIDIKAILSQLENGIVDLAKSTLKEHVSQATKDGKDLLLLIKDDLIRWTEELANGEITKAEFELLLIGQKDLVKMTALKQTGLTLARIDEFKTGIFNLIIETVTGLI